MTVTVLISVTSHVIIAGICKNYLPLPIICLWQVFHLVVILYLVEGLKPSFLKNLDH